MHKKASDCDSQNKHEYEKEEDKVNYNSEGAIGSFINNKIQIANSNFNFQDMHQEVKSRTVLMRMKTRNSKQLSNISNRHVC